MKLPASFRLIHVHPYYLLLEVPSPPQKTPFCSFSPKKSSWTHSPLSTASCKWQSQVSRHYHRMREEDRMASVRGSSSIPRLARGLERDGVCKSLMVPALEMRRARFLNLSSRRPSLLKGPCQMVCANVASLLCFKNSH